MMFADASSKRIAARMRAIASIEKIKLV